MSNTASERGLLQRRMTAAQRALASQAGAAVFEGSAFVSHHPATWPARCPRGTGRQFITVAHRRATPSPRTPLSAGCHRSFHAPGRPSQPADRPRGPCRSPGSTERRLRRGDLRPPRQTPMRTAPAGFLRRGPGSHPRGRKRPDSEAVVSAS